MLLDLARPQEVAYQLHQMHHVNVQGCFSPLTKFHKILLSISSTLEASSKICCIDAADSLPKLQVNDLEPFSEPLAQNDARYVLT